MDAAAFEGKCRTSPANKSSPRGFPGQLLDVTVVAAETPPDSIYQAR